MSRSLSAKGGSAAHPLYVFSVTCAKSWNCDSRKTFRQRCYHFAADSFYEMSEWMATLRSVATRRSSGDLDAEWEASYALTFGPGGPQTTGSSRHTHTGQGSSGGSRRTGTSTRSASTAGAGSGLPDSKSSRGGRRTRTATGTSNGPSTDPSRSITGGQRSLDSSVLTASSRSLTHSPTPPAPGTPRAPSLSLSGLSSSAAPSCSTPTPRAGEERTPRRASLLRHESSFSSLDERDALAAGLSHASITQTYSSSLHDDRHSLSPAGATASISSRSDGGHRRRSSSPSSSALGSLDERRLSRSPLARSITPVKDAPEKEALTPRDQRSYSHTPVQQQ